MATNKPVTAKGQYSKLEYIPNEDGSISLKGTRRRTRKEKKAGIEVDEETVLVTYEISAPDEFKCCTLTITPMDNLTELVFTENIEQFEILLDKEKYVFLRTDTSAFKDNEMVMRVLKTKRFVPDPNCPDTYELELALMSFTSLYMCLGLALGFTFGNLLTDSILLGPIGMGAGAMIGMGIDSSKKKARKKLKDSRGINFTKTVDEDGDEVKDEDIDE